MTNKPSDLIAIANPELAQRLSEKDVPAKTDQEQAPTQENIRNAHKTYQQEIWRAVFTLNLFRYAFSLALLGISLNHELNTGFKPITAFLHPKIFLICAIVLLTSATLFTVLTKTKRLPLRVILVSQFIIDTVSAGFIVHSTGSISSGFSLMFFLVVITGSVVLRRTDALALAAGAILIIFFEHFYSVLVSNEEIGWRFDSLAMYGVILMVVAISVSHLARLVRKAELQTFMPGNESIEDYLVREEINALKSALLETQGNKTEAAKLLGMTFRSFRYKVSKYEL